MELEQSQYWLKEYIYGFSQEIYTIPLSPAFTGKSFSFASDVLFKDYGICLFAVEIIDEVKQVQMERKMKKNESEGSRSKRKVLKKFYKTPKLLLVNPSKYRLHSGDIGFIIADDLSTARMAFTWDPENRPKHREVPALLMQEPSNQTLHSDSSGSKSNVNPSSENHAIADSQDQGSSVRKVTSADESENQSLNHDDKKERSGLDKFYSLTLHAKAMSHKLEAAQTIKECMQQIVENKEDPQSSPPPQTSESQFFDCVAQTESGTSPLGVVQPEDIFFPQVFPPPRDMMSASLLTSTASTRFEDHIIVCSPKGLSGLNNFVRPLRTYSNKQVVFLQPRPPTNHEWILLSKMSNVFYVEGSPLNMNDLKRAGIEEASVVLIFAECHIESGKSRLDTNAIFIMCIIESNFPCRCILEIVVPEAMKFLRLAPAAAPDMPNLPYSMWPQFCSGHVFMTSALDSLTCQAFYSPEIITVIGRLINDVMVEDEDSEKFSAQNITRQKYKENSRLVQMMVPSKFVEKPYGKLRSHLLTHSNILCMGLYRSSKVHNALLPYVITNPHVSVLTFDF